MASHRPVYITIEWQEQGPLETPGSRLWREDRLVCTPYCHGGGFEIGDRVAALLASDRNTEQNSLVCRNAIDLDRSKRCLHTIIYSITRVSPYQRQKPEQVVSDNKSS
jgi:hypothetical protein